MLLQTTDFNRAGELLRSQHSHQWSELEQVLSMMPLHLKASDQAGIQGNAIFDPVGTNSYVKEGLAQLGWRTRLPIPYEYRFLGTDVDFGKTGVIVEAQFSNYPFLLNNVVRSELFSKARVHLSGHTVDLAVIITKAHMFPASNSTLYYEQAQRQLKALASHQVFDVPIRLVGLFSERGEDLRAVFTEYVNPRYSRTVSSRGERTCKLMSPRTSQGRCTIKAG